MGLIAKISNIVKKSCYWMLLLSESEFPEEDITFFQEGLDRGGTILVLEVEKGDIPQVEDILGDAQVVLH